MTTCPLPRAMTDASHAACRRQRGGGGRAAFRRGRGVAGAAAVVPPGGHVALLLPVPEPQEVRAPRVVPSWYTTRCVPCSARAVCRSTLCTAAQRSWVPVCREACSHPLVAYRLAADLQCCTRARGTVVGTVEACLQPSFPASPAASSLAASRRAVIVRHHLIAYPWTPSPHMR